MLALLLAVLSAVPGKCVVDPSHVIPPSAVTMLEMECERIDKSGDGQVMIGVTTDLGGYSRNEYAVAQFKAWKIGHKGKDDGILILLVMPPAERGIKFEIGYGLEGRLNDGKVMAHWRDRAKPLAQGGRIGDALLEMTHFFAKEMHTEKVQMAPPPPAPRPIPYNETPLSSRPPPAKIEYAHTESDNIGWGVFWCIIIAAGLGWTIFYFVGRARKQEREAEEERRRQAAQEAQEARWEQSRRQAAHYAAAQAASAREAADRQAKAHAEEALRRANQEAPKLSNPPPQVRPHVTRVYSDSPSNPPDHTSHVQEFEAQRREARRLEAEAEEDARVARSRREEQARRQREAEEEAQEESRRAERREEERRAEQRREDDRRSSSSSSSSWGSSDSSSSSSDSGGFSGGDGGSSGGGGGSDNF